MTALMSRGEALAARLVMCQREFLRIRHDAVDWDFITDIDIQEMREGITAARANYEDALLAVINAINEETP